VTVKLAGDAPDKICSVVMFQIVGQPQVIAGQGPPAGKGKGAKAN